LAPTGVTINSGNMTNQGVFIKTTEINNSQELAGVGIDLNDFGITSNSSIVYGIQIETDGGDFAGFFQAAEDPSTQFSDVPSGLLNPNAVVPEASTLSLLAGLLALSRCVIRRRV
jgi:hypothetical protein